MGPLTLPAAGVVDADAQVCIYSVEQHPVYAPLLRPLWQAVQNGALEVVSSELALMETLVGPFKRGDTGLAATYEQFFQQPGIRLLPVTQAVLREAARLRATTRLRTPDAIHAATALPAAPFTAERPAPPATTGPGICHPPADTPPAALCLG
jgi:predicted nucleic acid-binding protein